MFLSRLWLFVIALIAAVAVMIALLLPRQAQRTLLRGEASRLQTACGVIHILLADDARNRVELVGAFARSPEIMNALEAAGSTESLDEARMKQVREIGDTVMRAIQGNRKPDFAMLIDRRGRVVARVRLDDTDFGDIAAGRPLIDDALAGYLRDDLWAHNGTMYFVSASPVVKQSSYAGAVVLGHKVTNDLAATLVKPLGVDMGFHVGTDAVAGSRTIAFDQAEMVAAIGALGDDRASDCQVGKPIEVRAGTEGYSALVARLPGEAGAKRAYYSVMIKRPDQLGLVATLSAMKDNDLSFAGAPWVFIIGGGGFIVALGLGIALMFFEAERPLRRLAADAMRLANAGTERMSEELHRGVPGSIARNVNRHIDKLGRDAKAAKNDLDQLLGPAPQGGLGTIDLLATSLPPVRQAAPAPAAPPPSEFRFQDTGPTTVRKPVPPSRGVTPQGFARVKDPRGTLPTIDASPSVPPQGSPRAKDSRVPLPAIDPSPSVTPPPFRAVAPPPAAPPAPAPPPPPPRMPQAPPAALSFDDDILGRGTTTPPEPRGDPHFKVIFEQFVSLKKSCNEPIVGLVYERFAEKLVRNRDDLMAKTGCREVRFTVYIKDGKAALKATPVKDGT